MLQTEPDQPTTPAIQAIDDRLNGWQRAEGIQAQLSRLPLSQAGITKRNTIIALIDARIAGRSEESVWSRPDTCHRSTYHGKHAGRGWKNDPLFADVLAQCWQIAAGHRERQKINAIALAADRLAMLAPAAVDRLAALLATTDENVAIKAIKETLDRAGMETASKSTTAVTGQSLEQWQAQAEDRRADAAATIAEYEAVYPTEEP